MIPFVRTVAELTAVKKIITSANLIRSSSFQLWMMAEIPSNVILLEDFLKVGIAGACEVIYVEDIKFLKKANVIPRILFPLSMYGLLLLVIFNLFAPAYLKRIDL